MKRCGMAVQPTKCLTVSISILGGGPLGFLITMDIYMIINLSLHTLGIALAVVCDRDNSIVVN